MGRVINHIKTYHFYPRSPCGERPDVSHRTGQKNLISIHALLAESDGVHYDNYNLHCVISIHALLAESDCHRTIPAATTSRFLSTLSLRRATQPYQFGHPYTKNFYPRSPCGERRGIIWRYFFGRRFLSTLSLRRATLMCHTLVLITPISIHALLAESDRLMKERTINWHQFLSTLSLRRATIFAACHMAVRIFLSTLSLRRATRPFCKPNPQRGHFYPRSPCGERPAVIKNRTAFSVFLSTLSLRRATP